MPNWLGFLWRHQHLTLGLAALTEVIDKSVEDHLKKVAQDMKAYAQANAPWEDQTGDARAGLDTEVFKDGSKYVLVLYHSVDYGIWLEIRWSGTYAIIMPTIEYFASEVLSGIELSGGGDTGDGDTGDISAASIGEE